jgi:hypothetical protein
MSTRHSATNYLIYFKKMLRKNKAKNINDAIEFFGVTFLARVVANYIK